MRKATVNTGSRHPAAAKLALALAVLLVFDFGAAQLMKARTRSASPALKLHGLPYEYGLLPNKDEVAAVWGYRRYRLRTNSLGFRDGVVRDIPLRAERPRVVFIGDSFTMGIGCDYENTFVGIVASELDRKGIEVLNAAVDGYSTLHYLRKVTHYLESAGLVFDELVCAIDLSDLAEDLARTRADGPVTSTGQRKAPAVAAPTRTRLPRLPHTAGFRSRLRENSLIVETLYRIKLRLAPDLPIDQRAVLWTTEDALYEEFGRQGIELQLRNIDALHAVLKRHGVKLTLVVYPWIDQILREDLDSRHVRIWREWCAANGARFIDCFPAFIGLDERPMDTVYRCFIRGDNHFNEAGHRVMAEAIMAQWDARTHKNREGNAQ